MNQEQHDIQGTLKTPQSAKQKMIKLAKVFLNANDIHPLQQPTKHTEDKAANTDATCQTQTGILILTSKSKNFKVILFNFQKNTVTKAIKPYLNK